MQLNQVQDNAGDQGLFLIDSDDAEGWLIEEGIGYLDESGVFQYGTDLSKDDGFYEGIAESEANAPLDNQ